MSKYRIKLINTKTNQEILTFPVYNSKKQALNFASDWKNAMPNANAKVGKIQDGHFVEVS